MHCDATFEEAIQRARNPSIFVVLFEDSANNCVIRGIRGLHDLRESIWVALKDNSMTIALNQVDIGFDAPATETFAGIQKIK